jgi:hypothetical protein
LLAAFGLGAAVASTGIYALTDYHVHIENKTIIELAQEQVRLGNHDQAAAILKNLQPRPSLFGIRFGR